MSRLFQDEERDHIETRSRTAIAIILNYRFFAAHCREIAEKLDEDCSFGLGSCLSVFVSQEVTAGK